MQTQTENKLLIALNEIVSKFVEWPRRDWRDNYLYGVNSGYEVCAKIAQKALADHFKEAGEHRDI